MNNSLALVRHGIRPAPKLLGGKTGPVVVTTTGEDTTTRSRLVAKKKAKVTRKGSKKKSTKKTSSKKTPRFGEVKRVKATNGRTMVFKFDGQRWKLTGNEGPARKKATKKTSKKVTKKTAKKKATKKTAKKKATKKASSRGYRVSKGESELARKLVEAREELARCKKRKTTKKTTKKAAKKTAKKAASSGGTVNVDAILKGGKATKVSGVTSTTVLRGKGRRAKPQVVWACAGPTYSGCGGGKKGRKGGHMLGHITDPRVIRRLAK